jgi:hypothetical protein
MCLIELLELTSAKGALVSSKCSSLRTSRLQIIDDDVHACNDQNFCQVPENVTASLMSKYMFLLQLD